MTNIRLLALLLPLVISQIAACGTLAATGSSRDSNNYGFNDSASTPSDASISAAIRRQLINDPGINASQISVSTAQGIVTLDGRVASAAIRDRIIMLCNRTSGVKQVNSRLRIDQY